MTELKMTTVYTNYVDYYDLTTFLSEKRGVKIGNTGLNNDTVYDFDVTSPNDGQAYLRFDEDDINEWLDKTDIDYQMSGAGPALQWAADNGWIPYGSYIISVAY